MLISWSLNVFIHLKISTVPSPHGWKVESKKSSRQWSFCSLHGLSPWSELQSNFKKAMEYAKHNIKLPYQEIQKRVNFLFDFVKWMHNGFKESMLRLTRTKLNGYTSIKLPQVVHYFTTYHIHFIFICSIGDW